MPRSYKDTVKALKDHDRRFFIVEGLGKGSHRMVCHPDSKRHYPLPYHGQKTIISDHMLRNLIRFFDLPRNLFS